MRIFKTIGIILSLNVLCLAGEPAKVDYTDVFSLQFDRRESWALENLGLNISRYFVVDEFKEKALFPGAGLRLKIGQNSKIEAFPKISFAGILGGSVGGFYSKAYSGIGSSVWIGPEFFGMEYSFYSNGDKTEQEISIYLAIQFAVKRDGRYGWENWFLIPWSWKMF